MTHPLKHSDRTGTTRITPATTSPTHTPGRNTYHTPPSTRTPVP
jgi:hypothetical protein